MGWVHPSGLGGQNAAVGIEDTGSPPHPRRFVFATFLNTSINSDLDCGQSCSWFRGLISR
jgi:hypothetical protein